MKVVIVIDSFKGSLSSGSAGMAAAEGIKNAYPDADTLVLPLADGGEGTVEAIISASGGKLVSVDVTGPLGNTVTAKYGVIPERGRAIIEMSSAAGITLVPPERRNPLYTTTYGVGELIADAIKAHGCRDFIIGIGGSATNDGGVGMLEALGFSFLDKNGDEIPHGAIGISKLEKIDVSGALPELSECRFQVACDVTNPLLGEHGCSTVFGPQKGASPDMIRDMDGWLADFAKFTECTLGRCDKDTSGAGAAGGLGFAFISYLGAELSSGIDLVIESIGLENRIKNADIVVTGEGRLDAQSAMGKAPVGVARLAKKYGKPVIAFSGCIGDGAELCCDNGIDAFFPIQRNVCTLSEAMDETNAYNNLKATAEQAFRLIKATSERNY